MKYLFLSISFLLIVVNGLAQSTNNMSFQAVIRDASGELVSNSSVGLKMSVLQGSVSGIEVYSETHNEMTNANGLLSLEIGGGTVVSGVYGEIDWSNGPYFLKREVDPLGGSNYVVSGTSQFLSVPYAIFASAADTVFNVPAGFDGDYTNLTNKPSIPTNTSDLTNDSGFLTAEIDSSTTNEIQELSVSTTKDTLFLSSGNYVLIPGISDANYPPIDFDGYLYDTVHIGTQIWFAENLKTTHYNDGTSIPNETDATAWAALSTGAMSYYNNDSTQYDPVYGALYNGYAVETNKLCPAGWHVSTDAEWTALVNFLGDESVAGGKLKEVGTAHWDSPNTGATDEVGFTALPSGRRKEDGSFTNIKLTGLWWTGTANNTDEYYYINMSTNNSNLNSASDNKRKGYAVRCLRD